MTLKIFMTDDGPIIPRTSGERLLKVKAALPELVRGAPIGNVKSIRSLRWLCRVVPLGHRLFPLLRPFVPEQGLVGVPFAGGRVLYPARWIGRYTLPHLFGLEQVVPEWRVFHSAVMASQPGAVVDVGANLGIYTLLIREVTSARVIAFEPSPLAFHVLQRMLDVNGLVGIEVRPKACGDKRDRVCMQEGINSYVGGAATPDERDFANFDRLCRQTREGFTSTDVEQVTLDDELGDEGAVALIKIDCEGFEHRILLGARRVLADKRPTLFIELHPELIVGIGDTAEDVCGFLRDLSYDVECWNFQKTRHASRMARLLSRYRTGQGHRYRNVDDMLADLPRSRPQQVYLVATPAERRAASARP